MNLEEAVAARRSIRAFEDRPVPRAEVLRAISLAVQAPAPHHSAPWRFSLVEEPEAKASLARVMGAAWRADLSSDGMDAARIGAILDRSYELLTRTPLLTVCSADMSRAHAYPDERRRLAEWSLFAHATGAALQVFMLALAEAGIATCWISAPVFCGDVVRAHLELPDSVEPQALVLVGHPSADYSPRPRGEIDPHHYVVGS
ncbi:MAG TPA: nitroreductase family protein [Actinomycetota bacterium]|nr:nitroreductase family protein [Actinomycetota bacterium]